MNVVRKMNIAKYCPKVFKFNDNATFAFSKGLFFFYQTIPSFTTSAFANTIQPAHTDYFVTFEFEDN